MAAGKTTSKKSSKKTAKTVDEKAKSKSLKKEIVILLVAAMVFGVVVFAMNAGNIAKGAAEKIASKSLGVQVTIDSMGVSLQDKQVEVSGIKVRNPAGYSKPYAITVESVSIAAESFSKELLTFADIKVNGASVNLEVTDQSTNLKDIRDYTAAHKGPEKASQPKVILRVLNIDQAVLNPSATLVSGDLKPVNIPNIRITGIGEQTNGVLASQAITQIFEYVSKTAMQQSLHAGYLQGMDPAQLDQLKGDFGLSSGAAQGLFDRVKGIFGN